MSISSSCYWIRDFRRAAEIGLAMIGAAALVALVVSVAAAGATRHLLDFPFSGIAPHAGEVLRVFANNVRLLGALVAGAALAQLADRTGGEGMRALTFACDGIVILACLNEVALVGGTVGAYGNRGLSALFPHGPVELLAYSVGLSLYVAARRERIAWHRALGLVAASVLGLALAAVLEVMR
jgi:hypothetical protein